MSRRTIHTINVRMNMFKQHDRRLDKIAISLWPQTQTINVMKIMLFLYFDFAQSRVRSWSGSRMHLGRAQLTLNRSLSLPRGQFVPCPGLTFAGPFRMTLEFSTSKYFANNKIVFVAKGCANKVAQLHKLKQINNGIYSVIFGGETRVGSLPKLFHSAIWKLCKIFCDNDNWSKSIGLP